MARWPRFTLRYLLLVMFWWALALALTREYLTNGDYDFRTRCLVLSGVAWGGAYGGLALKMQFGLIAGFIFAVALNCFLLWLASNNY